MFVCIYYKSQKHFVPSNYCLNVLEFRHIYRYFHQKPSRSCVKNSLVSFKHLAIIDDIF